MRDKKYAPLKRMFAMMLIICAASACAPGPAGSDAGEAMVVIDEQAIVDVIEAVADDVETSAKMLNDDELQTLDDASTNDDETSAKVLNDNEPQKPPLDISKPDGFIFTYNGTPVVLGGLIAPLLTELGPERDYYEYASCAFDGDAKLYAYDGFELSTYAPGPGEADRVYSVTFTDDNAVTAEGVRIGMGYAGMTAAYGTDYEEIPGSYIYERSGTILAFTVENKVITAVTYYVRDIYDNGQAQP